MPSAPDSHAPIQVYVQLLNEDVTVYRPTTGVPFGTGTVTLLAAENCDASGEEWEFPPGAVVRVERRLLSGGEVLIAVALHEGDP